MLITVSDAAAMLGLSSRGSLYRKIKEGKIESVAGPEGALVESDGLRDRWAAVCARKGSHPLRSVADRTAPRKLPEPPAKASTFDVGEIPDYDISRARTEYEKANLLELDRRKKEGELLLRDDVLTAWDQALAIVRSDMLGLASKCKERMPELEPEQVERMREVIAAELDRISAITFKHEGGADENS